MPPKKQQNKNKNDNSFLKGNDIINFYEIDEIKKNKINNKVFYKSVEMNLPCRIGLIGATGSGKSNVLLNFLGRLPSVFTKIIIVHKLEEPLYDYLKEQIGNDNILFCKGLDELPKFNELNISKDDRLLLIFDDIVNEPIKLQEDIILEYFLLGRKVKMGISMFYLSQSYYKMPKPIREQCNYLFIVKLNDRRDITSIINNNCLGVDKEMIEYIYKTATSKELDFLKIDLFNRNENRIFSKNWKEFFVFDDDN